MENPFEEKTSQRPTMLTVLCVLTFIGSGWSALSNLYGLFTQGSAAEALEMMQRSSDEMAGNSFMSGIMSSSIEVMEVMVEHGFAINSLNMVFSLLSLLGAYLMFKLCRRGFYLYAAAQVITLFILPVFTGFSSAVVLGMVWSIFITGIFILLYGLNLKYMSGCTKKC